MLWATAHLCQRSSSRHPARTDVHCKLCGYQHCTLLYPYRRKKKQDNLGSFACSSFDHGFDDCFANLLPADKISHVQSMAQQEPLMAMVGDGVNDAPALAAAPIGIALGAAASDVALAMELGVDGVLLNIDHDL